MKVTRLTLETGVLTLGPMLAATLRDHKVAIASARRGEIEPPEMLELTSQLAHACARRADPTITLAAVEDLVDMENFGVVFAACWSVSMPEVPPGEAVQAASPST